MGSARRASATAAARVTAGVVPLPRTPGCVQFDVPGIPVGQAGLSHYGRGRAVYSNAKRLDPWRETVRVHARQAVGARWVPLTGPVEVTCCFTLRRPRRPAHDLPITRGGYGLDLDHAERAVYDALTGVVYVDDAQIVANRNVKVYVGDRLALPGPGVRVLVRGVGGGSLLRLLEGAG